MNVLSAVAGFLNGNFATSVVEFVRDRFPPSMSDEDKARVALLVEQAARQHEIELERAALAKDAEFNQRIRDLEGTAADLKTIPILGPVVIFMRGAQRPIWGYATLWLDFLWFTSAGGTWSDQQSTAMIAINCIVLFFLFGERAAKNVMPIIQQVFAK